MKRPEINAEIITPAITEAVNGKHAPTCGDPEDIVNAYLDGYTDGYELAKELDDSYYWDVDLELAEWLDDISTVANRAYHKYLEEWAKLNNITPKYNPGDEVYYKGFKAVITSTHEYRPLSYRIQYKENQQTPRGMSDALVGSNCNQIVWFDDIEQGDRNEHASL